MKVAVKEAAAVLVDAIKSFHDQTWPIRRREIPFAADRNVDWSRGGGLTRSRTKESFAKDWSDRLLSEYRFGCSEAGFELGTSAVATNRG